MAADFQQISDKISGLSTQLVDRMRNIVNERDRALQLVADQEATIKEHERTIERLQQQVEYLTVVSTVMPDSEDIEKSRTILSGLVREIDKCINDLTE